MDYGIDLAELIGEAATESLSASLPGIIRAELLKDERIEFVEVDVSVAVVGPAAHYTIDIRGQTGEGPFSLSVGVSEVSVELLGIGDTA